MAFTSQDIVPFNKARANLTALADEVRAGHEKIITRNGESYVALVDTRKLDYYHQLEREKQAQTDFHLALLNDAVAGLEEIRNGESGISPAEASARASEAGCGYRGAEGAGLICACRYPAGIRAWCG